MKNSWHSAVINLGIIGLDWVYPIAMSEDARAAGIEPPLEIFIKKLRSGEDMPASAVAILADIFEGKYPYKLELVRHPKNAKQASVGADAIGIGLEIERLVRDKGHTVSSVVALLAEYLEVDDRTVWRYWKRHQEMYPDGYLEKFEENEKPFQEQLRQLRRQLRENRGTDKK